MSRGPPIGELVVVALKAEKLQHQAPGKQNPFCLFRVGDIVKRTKTDHGGGQYPIWDDQVNIPVTAGYHQLNVQIFDKDTNPNNLMAEGIVDLTKVLREKEHDGYFPLSFRGRPGTGVIYLELTFYSAQNMAARPQQQVRYQYPPGHVPGDNFHPPPSQYHRPPPPPMGPQSSHMRHNRPPPMHMQPTPPQQRPQMYPQQQRPLPQPPIQHRPPPLQQQHSPYPPPQPRPSQSMGTAQVFSPVMPSPQPLLSAPYNPAPSPAQRPANLNYPPPNNQQRQSYPVSLYPPPPGGFHGPSPPQQPQQQPYYPPEPQTHVLRPMAPGGFNTTARPNNNSYPPY